jgi:flagellar biosynthesis protein
VSDLDTSPGGHGDTTAKAVAVAYEPATPRVPRVVAKGKGKTAERILEIAFAHGVKVREDADLVEVLSAVELDADIPLEAFAAVAEILSYVYRANGRMPPAMSEGAPDPAPESEQESERNR